MTFPHVLLFFIPAIMACLDRYRGGSGQDKIIPKPVALLGLGSCVILLLGVHDFSAVTVLAAVWAGYVTGWGQPLGRILDAKRANRNFEWWQFGPLKKNPYLAMTVRGLLILPAALAANAMLFAISGLLMLAAPSEVAQSVEALFISAAAIAKLTIVFGIAFPLAPFIAVKLGKRGDAAWALQEYIRGGLIGALLLIARFV